MLSVSGGRSHHFTKRFPNALKGDFSPGFKMELGEKDLALAVELGRMTKMPTPSASATREMYALALAEGFRGQDIVALLQMYKNWAKPRLTVRRVGKGAFRRAHRPSAGVAAMVGTLRFAHRTASRFVIASEANAIHASANGEMDCLVASLLAMTSLTPP